MKELFKNSMPLIFTIIIMLLMISIVVFAYGNMKNTRNIVEKLRTECENGNSKSCDILYRVEKKLTPKLR